MHLGEFQRKIEEIYLERDRRRGLEANFMWLAEEMGELSRALRREDHAAQMEEFADCLAWLATIASIAGIDFEQAVEKYKHGCPRCHSTPCACPE
jgi:NTP pyrophosphatase (non-canonical NTP hydrolase)